MSGCRDLGERSFAKQGRSRFFQRRFSAEVMEENDLSVCVVTNMPSHYQVDLFNQLALQPGIALTVLYLQHQTLGRQWAVLRTIQHQHEFLRYIRLPRSLYFNPGLLKRVHALNADVTVVTQYLPTYQPLMYDLHLRNRTWVFWSERPGVEWTEHQVVKSERLRQLGRSLLLRPLRAWPANVWAIGAAAVSAYERLLERECINVPYFSDLRGFKEILRSDVSPTTVRFLYAGKLNHRKGADVLVDAVRDLAGRGFQFQITVAGDGPLREEVKRLATSFPSVVEYAGFLELEDMPRVFGEADVFVCPSRYDGWAMVVPEALAAGMPVIATNTTGAARQLVQTQIGHLIDPDSAQSLSEAMLAYIQNPVQIPSKRHAARESVQHLSAESGAALMARLLRETPGKAAR